MRHCLVPTRRPLLFGLALAACLTVVAVGTAPADVVVLKDGFVIQGSIRKEMEEIRDRAIGPVSVPRANGFDFIDDGPRLVIFSAHQIQSRETNSSVKLRPEYRAFLNRAEYRKSNHPFPGFIPAGAIPNFNARWKRTVRVLVPGGFDDIEQQITYLDPYTCVIVSTTHLWSQSFRTSEMDPQTVRKLLSTHPDLVEPAGKPDPMKRLAIARFLKDVDWVYLAKEEIEQLKKLVPGPLSKDAQAELDRLQKEMDTAVAELVTTEAESALTAGRYKYAGDVLAAFPEKTAGSKELDQFTRLKARLETVREQYATGRRLLRSLLDDLSGARGSHPLVAVGGGTATAVWRGKRADTQLSRLIAAGEQVYAEVHPDTAGRIEFFVNLAAEAERNQASGKAVTKTPNELLATAVSGWVKGKNGATTSPDLALRLWGAREIAIAYQRGATHNGRQAILADYKSNRPVDVDEMAQVISLLPPAEPEDLNARTGTLVRAGGGVPNGVYKRRSAPYGNHPTGLDYFVRLPPEYHHGRAYPLIVLLSYPELPPDRLMGAISSDADKNGYIVIAPDWCSDFKTTNGWQWNGADHDYVLATLRDAIRHFTIDNNRVYMIGAGLGADMAFDVGVSHPDQFAGVVAMGTNPKWQGFLLEYWRNAQKLPFYVVNGQMATEENVKLRYVFVPWMRHGFPSLNVVYKGRGLEWFPAEIPLVFDWMGRKKRANGVSTLRLGPEASAPLPWRTSREGDNRFYWLGAEQIAPQHLADNLRPGQALVPATLTGDIRGNSISVTTTGVRRVSVWLSRDMIDWTQKVNISVKGNLESWKPRILEPDMSVLLEDYYARGDRRMLYLARLEFETRY